MSYPIEVFETLSGRTFGILAPEDEGIHLLEVTITHELATKVDNFDELANLCRAMVEAGMRYLSGNSDYKYPLEEKFQVGLID